MNTPKDHDLSYGYFTGPLQAEFLVEEGEDWKVRLLLPLTFVDARDHGVSVTVPTDYVVNGANIPPFLWPVFGSPLTGDYRRATVIHDFECNEYPERSAEIHARFYRAMRADGVGRFRARAMHLGVVAYWKVRRRR